MHATIRAVAQTSIRYFADGRGREPVREYVEALRRGGEYGAVASFRHLLELIEAEGAPLGMPQDRMIDRSERVWELRFGNHRCAYAIVDGGAVLLHAWRKQTRRLDARAAATALRRLRALR